MKKEGEITIKGNTAILVFDRYQEREELELALNAGQLHAALWDIAQDVFRPHRKYGYADVELQKLNENPEVNKAIGLLEKMFYDILEQRKIEM